MNIFHWSQWWWEILFMNAFYSHKKFNIIWRFIYIWWCRSFKLQIGLHCARSAWFWWSMGSLINESDIMTRQISITIIVYLYSITLSIDQFTSTMTKSCTTFVRQLSLFIKLLIHRKSRYNFIFIYSNVQ